MGCFWTDLVGCTEACGEDDTPGDPSAWLFNQFMPSGQTADLQAGDALTVVGTPACWYLNTADDTGDAAGSGCNIFGPNGCGHGGDPDPDADYSGYVTVSDSASKVPSNPYAPGGGIYVPADIASLAWQEASGGNAMSITVTAIDAFGNLTFGADDATFVAELFGANVDAIDQLAAYITVQNQRTGEIYGWLYQIGCHCF